jgi:hypothetical protein
MWSWLLPPSEGLLDFGNMDNTDTVCLTDGSRSLSRMIQLWISHPAIFGLVVALWPPGFLQSSQRPILS